MNRFACSFLLASAFVGTFLPGTVGAQTLLVEYDFLTNLDASFVETDVGATALSAGTGLGSGSDWGRSSTAGNPLGSAFARNTMADQATFADSKTDNTYFQFTLSVDPGQLISLDSVSFDIGATKTTGYLPAASFTAGFFLTSDQDGFVGSLGGESIESPTGTGTNWGVANVTLDGLLSPAESVTFRIYLTTSELPAPPDHGVYRVDNISVNGSVIPEPSAYALLAMGGGVFWLRRSRRRGLRASSGDCPVRRASP